MSNLRKNASQGLDCDLMMARQHYIGEQNEDEENCGSKYTPSLISPSTIASIERKSTLLNGEETAVFHTLFKDVIHRKKTIKRDYVVSQIEKNPTLKHLLTTFSPLQLADKVRTERKIAEGHCK